jgi:hypothetical protein
MRLLLKGKMMFDETKLPQPSPEKRGIASLLNSVGKSLILKRQLREKKKVFPATAPPMKLYPGTKLKTGKH